MGRENQLIHAKTTNLKTESWNLKAELILKKSNCSEEKT